MAQAAVVMDMLEFDFWTVLFSVINILVLFFFLKKFLFGRVNAMLEQRARMVQEQMDHAEQSAIEADQLKEKREAQLQNARQEARQIIQTAQQNAQVQGDKMIAQSQSQADDIIAEAQKEIEAERLRMMDGVQVEIADLALTAASRLMRQQMNDEINRSLVDAFLSEEGAGEP